MATPSQQAESPPQGGERPVSLEREMASIVETMSHTAVQIGLILFGLLLDFVGQLVKIASTTSAAFSAFQVLTAIGTFVIIAVLFVSGMTKRSESDQIRLGLLIAAAIVFFTLPLIMA